ncbi:hypothetical protein KBK19_16800 [Microvirga sp. STR05]|uniref:Uncharacterized protein n=1 Tax=Hymenobacter duratus TaxID=2771356 RepID=A0ABR8JIL5_9BACT|nr:hypothetical protein [Hymenobacter duratus]MBD2716706.1 hypothetical protein [Hymenobacter duratus]MBR7951621.1 hypothetical protein [Microvirga sp. STR05]
MSLLALATSPSGIGELARTSNPDARLMLAEVSVGLTPARAAAAAKLFQLKKQLGEDVVVRLLVIILRAFVDSVRVADKPDAADILEMADTLAQTYTHDSVKDIILAFKQARTSGTRFYNALDPATIYGLLNKYFDQKARHLENHHLDQKAQAISQEAVTLHHLQQAAPALVQNVALMIPDSHPNAQHLRDKLTLIKQKHRRGLLTDEQAEQQRHEVQQAIHRHPRPDWQPSEAVQQYITRRHQQATHRFADKLGIDNPKHLGA